MRFDDGLDVIETKDDGRRCGFERTYGTKRSENKEGGGGVRDEQVGDHLETKYTKRQPPMWRRRDCTGTSVGVHQGSPLKLTCPPRGRSADFHTPPACARGDR